MQEDPLMTVRQTALRNQISVLDERLATVKQNAASVEEKIYRILQDALYTLQTLTDRKVRGGVQ